MKFEAKVWQLQGRWFVELHELEHGICGWDSVQKWEPSNAFGTKAAAMLWARNMKESILRERAGNSAPEWVRV